MAEGPVHSRVVLCVPGLQGPDVTADCSSPESVLSGEVRPALPVIKSSLLLCEGIDIEQQHPTLRWKSLDQFLVAISLEMVSGQEIMRESANVGNLTGCLTAPISSQRK